MFKKILGFLTDLLTAGRKQGWWEKGQGPEGSITHKKEDLSERS